jgi:hypothetical protein
MGALIHYTRDPFKPGVYEVRPTVADITARDAVRSAFPELIDRAVSMQRNGRALYDDDVLHDGDTVWISIRPEWFAPAAGAAAGFWTQLGFHVLNAAIYAAAAYLVSYLLRPKGKKDKAASPSYSVAIDQNAARLAGTIPVQYGRCLAMPDIASQPYAEFINHNERVSMILCLGMGEYDIHDIFLGESRVLDFPPGNVVTWVFRPQDHLLQYGRIEAITGVCEDMLSIPESMGVDLAAPNDPPEVTVGGSVSGGTLLPMNPQESQLWVGLVPGKQYIVANSVGGSVVVRYVGVGANNSAVFDGPLPAPPAATWIDTPLQVTPVDDAQEGRMMLLYAQKSVNINANEVIYIDDWPFTTRLGPFQASRSAVNNTRWWLRMTGPGFVTATGEQGFFPMRNGAVVRNAFVTYTVTEYVPGVDPAEPYRWRGWYASSRPSVNVDCVFVDITMPNGVAWITDDGDYRNMTTTFFVDIQQVDDAGNPVGGVRRETIRISGATSTARRLTYKYLVGAARYRIRVARVNNRDQRASKEISAAVLASIRTRIYHAAGSRAYENCTLLVMQFTASAGLNAASNRRVTIDCTRKVLWQGFAGLGPSTNPADAFGDAYINADYGGGRPVEEVDQNKLFALRAQWDTTNGFNGIFDSETTLIEALQAILAPVKALPLPNGKQMSVVQDAPRPRNFAFGDDTIVKDSLTVAYLFDGENQPDCLCVTYRDPRTFVEARVFYPTEGVRAETVELFGCTSRDHALAWARLTWQQRIYNRKRCTLTLEGEGYLLDPLDRFGVTIPAVAYGAAGRCIQFDQIDATSGDMLCDCEVPANTTQGRLLGGDGVLSAAFNVAMLGGRSIRCTGLPWIPHNAGEHGDPTNFVLLHDASQFYEFGVSDLKTTGALRVEVTGQQYTATAYSGTFVENWITGD